MAGMQDLSTMFANGDFGLLDRGLQAQKTGQQTNEATLAGLLQKQQQEAAMHPLDMQAKTASTGLVGAQTRNTNALAQTHENQNKLFSSIPMDARVQDQMNQYTKNATAAEMEQMKAHMDTAAWAASEALNNGGVLPMVAQMRLKDTHPEIYNYFKRPDGANILANMVTSFNALGADRQKSDAAHATSAGATMYGADKASERAVEVARLKATQEQSKLQARLQQAGVDPIKQQAALIMQANEAEQAGDIAQAQVYRQWAQSLNNVAALQGRNLPQAGGVSIEGQTKGGVATVPQYDAVPGNKSNTPVQLPKEAMSQLQEGVPTQFRNGQVWTLRGGQATRIK